MRKRRRDRAEERWRYRETGRERRKEAGMSEDEGGEERRRKEEEKGRD